MGVYIKDMEMPKSFPLVVVIDAAGTARRYDLNNDRYADNELFETISVPPHGRLIDADAAERHLVKMQQAQKDIVARGVRKSRAVLRDLPSIIPADGGAE